MQARMANREGLETCLAQNTEKQHFFYGLYGLIWPSHIMG